MTKLTRKSHSTLNALRLIIFTSITLISSSSIALPISTRGHQPDNNQVFVDKLQTLCQKKLKQLSITALSISLSRPHTNKTINVTCGDIKKGTVKPINPEMLFQLGSITKSFIAARILQLVSDGELKLNDTLGKILINRNTHEPLFPIWENVTIKQLLNMRSGIFDYTHSHQFQMAVSKNPNFHFRSRKLVNYAYHNRPNLYFKPDTGFHYSNTNYLIAAMIINKITGESIQKNIAASFIGAKNPYHLKNLYYITYKLPPNLLKRMAHGYDMQANDMTNFNFSIPGAAGALIGTPQALCHWARLLFKGKVLQSSALQAMLTFLPQGKEGSCLASTYHARCYLLPGERYGLGIAAATWPKLGLVYFHPGNTPGYSSLMLWSPHYQAALAFSASGVVDIKQLVTVAKSIGKTAWINNP